MFTFEEIKTLVHDLIDRDNPKNRWVTENVIFAHIGGSHLYGTNIPGSDFDYRLLTVAPADYWIGAYVVDKPWTYKLTDEAELVIYDIRHWIRLAFAVNPNVIESVFIPPALQLYKSPEWDWIEKEVRGLFNMRAYHTFYGYAQEQLNKAVTKQQNKTGRQELIAKHGFDTKFMSHCLRLCRQGQELITTGKMTFPRPDADELKAIRTGEKWGNDFVLLRDYILKEIDSLNASKEQAVLQDRGQIEDLNALLIKVYNKCVTVR